MRLEGKVTVITGAASGLGEATARRFAREGAVLVLGDFRHDAGKSLAEKLSAAFVPCDVTREEDVAALVDRAIALHGSSTA
ncbi:SDR family oxidoreductase [Novosphingobium resinovorum]